MPKKRVKINYRRYLRGADAIVSTPLSQALAAALQQKVDNQAINDAVKLRTYEDDDGSTVILNGRLIAKSGVFGEIVRYNQGSNIPLLIQAEGDAAELQIREGTKPNNGEFLRGMAFFYAFADHFLIIEQDLSSAVIEKYFRWLLCTQTKTAVKDGRVQLVPRVFLEGTQPALKEVQSIRLQPPPALPSGFALEEVREVGSDSISTNILELLKSAHFDTAVLEQLAAEHQAAIQIQLNVTFKIGKNNLSLQGDEALALLRNVPEEDLILEGKGARNNRGVLERLSLQQHIEVHGTIFDRADAWRALQDTANEYRAQGTIE